MTKPIRIQRKRTKGWKMPPNTVSVTRPGKYGNPYIVGVDGTAEECVAKFRRAVQTLFAPRLTRSLVESHFAELRGKNLACFCPLDQPCHADVLLELANA